MHHSRPAFFYVFLFSAGLWPTPLFSQSVNASLNEDYYHWIDRYEVASGRLSDELFTTIKPYKRSWIVSYVDSLQKNGEVFKSASDKFNYDYLRNDSWEWSRAATSDSRKPFLRYFYRKKSDFAHVDIPEFDFHVSPVLYFAGGMDPKSETNPWINLRGIEMRGMVDRKVGFYAFIGENQSVLPSYVDDEKNRTFAVQHEGFWKGFKTSGVDFFQARGYIDFNVSKHIYMQFGHDKMFIGNGVRSLIWSDWAPPQLYMRANVKVWKLNYLFQLNRMVADVNGSPSGLSGGKYPEKFVAMHHVSFNIARKLNFSVFESVVFSPSDSVNGGSFEWNYMNPVIFYRAIEHQFGSADNVILGADMKWNVVRNVSLYGQVVVDEFLLDEVMAGNGWWANKFAFQAGAKYINAFGVSNLDLLAEANIARPYTYSHSTMFTGYSNYKQAIAHPAGANFREVIGTVRYQPIGRLNLSARVFYTTTGKDGAADENWGADILKSNKDREMEYGNETGQGQKTTVLLGDFTASYMIAHNLFIDLKQVIRKSESDAPQYNQSMSLTSFALRLNIAQRNYDF
jgi:hypothetical protein